MSSISAPSPAAFLADDAVQWRATQKDLWVGRRDGRHLGTVEGGRRYLATDAVGEPLGSFRTLEQAKAAVGKQCAGGGGPAGRLGHPWAPLAFTAVVAATAAALLGASGLLLL